VGTSLLNNQRGQNNPQQYREVFLANLLLIGAAAVAGALFIGLFGTKLLRLYGKSFPEGRGILGLLLCAAVVEAIAMASYQVLQSEEKMWLSLLGVMLPRDIALATLAFLLTPAFGAFGLGLAHLIAWLICSTVIFSAVFRIGLTPRAMPPPLYQAAQLSGVLEGDPEL
jgi:O-antigen/teichoic acid export membrane protein